MASLLQAFAQSVEFINDTAAAVIAFQNLEVAGTPPTSGTLFSLLPGGQTIALTTGNDNVTGVTTVTADLSPYTLNGKGPTLNTGDVLSNITNFVITDQYGQANDVIPFGVTLNNVQNFVLQTNGNAGVGVNPASGFTSNGFFDVSAATVTRPIAGERHRHLQRRRRRRVKAAVRTNITVTHTNAARSWSPSGGANVVLTDNSNTGADFVGSFISQGANPTGTVTVVENGSNSIVVSGGMAAAGSTAVSVTRYGAGAITIGDAIISLVTPGTNVSSGNIVVTDNDTIQAAIGPIAIFGGQNVTVNATPITGGNITIGTLAATGAAPVSVNPTTGQQFVATGVVTVNDNVINAFQTIYSSGASYGTNANVTVVGGTTVAIKTNTGSVLVGATAVLAANGSASNLFNGTVPVLAPNGTSRWSAAR